MARWNALRVLLSSSSATAPTFVTAAIVLPSRAGSSVVSQPFMSWKNVANSSIDASQVFLFLAPPFPGHGVFLCVNDGETNPCACEVEAAIQWLNSFVQMQCHSNGCEVCSADVQRGGVRVRPPGWNTAPPSCTASGALSGRAHHEIVSSRQAAQQRTPVRLASTPLNGWSRCSKRRACWRAPVGIDRSTF